MKLPETEIQFYRYEAVVYANMSSDDYGYSSAFRNLPKLVLYTYNLHKETSKGYWIGHGYYAPHMLRGNSRWVSKTALKRYAYPTKEEALNNYIKRTEKRIKILIANLGDCEYGLKLAKVLEKTEKDLELNK